MARSISKINQAKASTAKPLVNPLYGDKSLGLDPDIQFYEIEDDYNTKEE